MKADTMLVREVYDSLIADMCNTNCMCCEKYKTVKQMNKECLARKARGRITKRQMREAQKRDFTIKVGDKTIKGYEIRY